MQICEAVTSDIYRLVLSVNGGAELDFTPGQYLDLHVPGTELRRSFSLACLPGTGQLEFLIKAYAGGAFAKLLADGGLEPGSSIGFTGPYGSFRLVDSERDVLLVAGGSGMAPVLSLLRELSALASTRKIRFYYGARTSADLFNRELIEQVSARSLADFEYVEVLSARRRGRLERREGWVHEAAAQALAAGELADPEVYTCGPPPMVDALVDLLTTAHGVDERDIRYDKFTTAVDGVSAVAPLRRPGVGSARSGHGTGSKTSPRRIATAGQDSADRCARGDRAEANQGRELRPP